MIQPLVPRLIASWTAFENEFHMRLKGAVARSRKQEDHTEISDASWTREARVLDGACSMEQAPQPISKADRQFAVYSQVTFLDRCSHAAGLFSGRQPSVDLSA